MILPIYIWNLRMRSRIYIKMHCYSIYILPINWKSASFELSFRCWILNTITIAHCHSLISWLLVTWQCQKTLQWHHNECDDVWNHQPHNCLLNRLFRCRSKKTSKLCVTGLGEGNSLVTGEFSAQRPSNSENVSIWWHHYARTWANVLSI